VPVQESASVPAPTVAPAAYPPGWREVLSDDGEIFYYNDQTGVSQWESPSAAAPDPAPTAPGPAQLAFDVPAASAGPSSAAGSDVSASSRRAARRAARASRNTAAERSVSTTDEVQFADPSQTDLFMQDSSASLDLPSMSDFRAREASAARAGEGRSAVAKADTVAASAPKTSQELARDRLMELLTFDTIDGPSAEMVDLEPYDWTARLIGRGLPNKAGAYLLPYLQTGHMLLVGVLLLCALISYPGFPLTQVPDVYRTLLLQGLGITFAINAGTAVYSRSLAAAKQEPVGFWMAKCLLLGGLALGELTQAVPEPAPKQRKRR